MLSPLRKSEGQGRKSSTTPVAKCRTPKLAECFDIVGVGLMNDVKSLKKHLSTTFSKSCPTRKNLAHKMKVCLFFPGSMDHPSPQQTQSEPGRCRGARSLPSTRRWGICPWISREGFTIQNGDRIGIYPLVHYQFACENGRS